MKSVSVSSRGNSVPRKVKKTSTTRGVVNKSMNTENEVFYDKYNTVNKPSNSRVGHLHRSFVKDVPIKENNRKYTNGH